MERPPDSEFDVTVIAKTSSPEDVRKFVYSSIREYDSGISAAKA